MSHFKLISATKASDLIPVSKYVSEKTGITVIIGEVEGPVVDGYLSLATEAHDDDGLPHTLEHLIFLGSERYPYKGILDLAANRCMAHGTNAWTDVDHTCYTVSTAGDQGMLTLLPIYLNHILYPTLTEHGFITEVHHVDADGQDAGVVYCEMQGRENAADCRCDLAMIRAMYPNSGYSSETGGILKNLRESTNNTKVRDFHKKFYRPENVTVILAGQIQADDVFEALSAVEDDIIAKRANEQPEEWVKPWQSIPQPPKYGELSVQWPADTEDCGMILFAWRGPLLSDATSQKELTAVAILLRYLCETASAPLQKRLVEREDALAGDISFNLRENLATCVSITLENVPVDRLEQAKDETLQCLKALRDGQEDIDVGRIGRLLRKFLRENRAMLDADPHSAIAFRCIADALYSQTEEHFISRMNPEHIIEELKEESVEFWLGLLRKYISDDLICVVGSPSIQLQTQLADEEETRKEMTKKSLGAEGLAAKDKELQAAIEFNNREPPAGTLAAVPIPSCTNLKCHSIKSWTSDSEPCPHLDLKEMPLFVKVDSMKTNFVYFNLTFDTSSLDGDTRSWIPLYKSALAECPVRRGDQLIPHQHIISTKEQLTITFNIKIGAGSSGNFCVGEFNNFLFLETGCEPEDYDEVVNFLYEILYAAELNKERMLVCTQRLINEVAQIRRRGGRMVTETLRDSIFSKDSNVHWCSLLRQQKFLKVLLDKMNAGGDTAHAAISEATTAFRKISQTCWLHLVSNFDRYKLTTEPWKKFASENEIVPRAPVLYSDASLLSKWGGGFVLGVGGEESSHLKQYSPGPSGHRLEDVAPLTVALNYFTQLEGPMWRLIRGCGLSYGYSMVQSNDIGCIVFNLSRATNAIGAYNKARDILKEYLADPKFDEDLFESAKSASVYAAVVTEKCPADVITKSLVNYLRQVEPSYNTDLVCAISAVTAESASAAAARWLPSLFDASRSKLGVACHPKKVADIQAAFAKIELKLDAFESLEASPLNE